MGLARSRCYAAPARPSDDGLVAELQAITDEFERRGYRWAYRVVDTYGFGLPQRRERVYLVASREVVPAAVLLAAAPVR